jgi:hypothetical protein
MYFYEQAVRGIFKTNLRLNFLKEILFMISTTSLPFDGFASDLKMAPISVTVEDRIRMLEKGKKFEDEEQFKVNPKFGETIVLDVNRINFWIIAYSESIEKQLIKQGK